MKPGANFEQSSHASADFCQTARGFGHASQNLEQRTLARAVAADDADDPSLVDIEETSFNAQT